jgi:hypothetical protein
MQRIVQTGDLLDIRVLNHIIVGDDGHFNFRNKLASAERIVGKSLPGRRYPCMPI